MADDVKTYQLSQEVRIASVMFGGVSLAIYMNGIAQEMLRGVRATAPGPGAAEQEPADDQQRRIARWSRARELDQLLTNTQLESTERIYRIIGRSLFHGRQAGAGPVMEGPIRTRIVVDMLAGTSAGGINSVYLAKALVNNQNLDELKQMWMTEADIDTLLNDGGSDPGTYPPGPTTTSLLNSTRMYGLLYRAFHNMDVKQAVGSPLADDLDLFVTTTDLDGMATPIQLADRVVEERVHKASFHFVFGAGRPGQPNDFTETFNPMLAFASRCTSSFPVAFKPMTLEDVDRLMPGLALAIQQDPDHPLRKFFAQFERNNPGLSFVLRPLADGGYLNNKPFSFVVDQITTRTGAVPVRRKLLFLDPFPELNSQVRHTKQDVGFLENALDAASTLPRYQTIREDIERLNEYNRNLYAAQSLAQEIEDEMPGLARAYAGGGNPNAYPTRELSNLEAQFGLCYRTYHRLRVSAVSTELSALVTRLFGLDDHSDALVAVRMLIRAWREEHFAPNHEGNKGLETLFLTHYDMGFRFRRADYVRGRIDALLAALEAETPEEQAHLSRLIDSAVPPETSYAASLLLLAAKEEAVRELYRLRDQIEYVKWKLGFECERMRMDPARDRSDERLARRRNELMAAIGNTGLTLDDLNWILTPVEYRQCLSRANILYATGERPAFDLDALRAAGLPPMAPSGPRPVRENIVRAAALLAAWYAEILAPLSGEFLRAVERVEGGNLASAVGVVREFVWVNYQYFDVRDMQVFTVMQNQLTGEGSPVEIYRVSPLDAALLRTNGDPSGADKLAGTALFAFGAFLSGDWRRNDMMWGRLDGAERIIGAMLPDEEDAPMRRELCERAFRQIIEEEFTPSRCSDLIRPLMAYLKQRIPPGGKTADEFLAAAMGDSAANCPALVEQLLQSIADNRDRLAVFRAYYVKPADPPVPQSLDRLRRAIRIFGDMLSGLDRGNGPFTSIGGTLANVGAALTRFAEFCVPQSLGNAFFHYAQQLLFFVAIVLIVTGAFFYKEVETAGWIVLGITTSVKISAWLVLKLLFRKKTGRRIVGTIGAVVLLVATMSIVLIHLGCQAGAWTAPFHAVIGLNRTAGCK